MGFLKDQDAAFVRDRLAKELQHPVRLEFFTPTAGGLVLPGTDGETAEYARQILAEVAALSGKVTLNVHSAVAEPEAIQVFGIARTPATAIIGAQDYGIRFYGMPAGYEFVTLLELIIAVSQGTTPIAQPSRDLLARLKHDTHIQVFATPT
jgi:alkyl hydroperoxide reductase subunit AhpF